MDDVHGEATSQRGLKYQFTQKHRTGGDPTAARWLPPPDLTREEEFQIFDEADRLDVSDESRRIDGLSTGDSNEVSGNLYGMRTRDAGGRLRQLGTLGQVVSKYWWQPVSIPWHGFPMSPIRRKRIGANKEKGRQPTGTDDTPPSIILQKLENLGKITVPERKRLEKGRIL